MTYKIELQKQQQQQQQQQTSIWSQKWYKYIKIFQISRII